MRYLLILSFLLWLHSCTSFVYFASSGKPLPWLTARDYIYELPQDADGRTCVVVKNSSGSIINLAVSYKADEDITHPGIPTPPLEPLQP